MLSEQSLTDQDDAATAVSGAIGPHEQCACYNYSLGIRKTYSHVYSHSPCLLCNTAALQ